MILEMLPPDLFKAANRGRLHACTFPLPLAVGQIFPFPEVYDPHILLRFVTTVSLSAPDFLHHCVPKGLNGFLRSVLAFMGAKFVMLPPVFRAQAHGLVDTLGRSILQFSCAIL